MIDNEQMNNSMKTERPNHSQGNRRRMIRFGVMCQGPVLKRWQADSIRKLLELDNVELALIIEEGQSGKSDKPASLLRKVPQISPLWWIYRKLLVRPAAKESVDMTSVFSKVSWLICSPERRGKYSQYFKQDDLDLIREHDLDFILRYGFGIIRGDIHQAARWGIWSFHHDDEEKYRGAPACFWEIYHDDPVTGTILQRLTDDLDAGYVLRKGYFKTRTKSYEANLEAALSEGAEWPAVVCKGVLNENDSHAHGVLSETQAPVYREPSTRHMIVFFIRLLRNRIKLISRIVLRSRPQWNIGLCHPQYKELISKDFLEISWFQEPSRGVFTADPFGYHDEDGLHILYEKFSYREAKGRIEEMTYPPDVSFNSHHIPFGKEYHMSYPYILEHDGSLYCIPEIHESKSVCLYVRRTDGEWELETVILDEIPALDPTLVYHDGLWWMFYVLAGALHHNAKLHIQFADQLHGPWTPHPLNPVKVDVRSARPAGHVFRHKGDLFRPAQDCSMGYGSRIAINKVKRLTTTSFEEEIVNYVRPANGPYTDGFHTLSFAGDDVLVDGLWQPVNLRAVVPRTLELLRKRFLAKRHS